jgi:DNA sulfur modification protein DndD
MKIEKIVIQNFGIISDMEIDMVGTRGNLVFINGRNGRGKTTFQSALRWCFYGEEPSTTGKFASRYGLKQISEGDTLVAKVSAEISLDAEGHSAYIERTQLFQKQPSPLPPKKLGNPQLIVKTRAAASDALVDVQVNPEAWIQQYFPQRLLNFFLFDGEKMTNFFHSNVKGEIEKAIREIAGVDLFEAISKNLSQVEEQLNKKISKLTGPKTEKIAGDLEVERRLLTEIFTEYNESKDLLGISKNRAGEINSSLGESRDIQSIAQRIEEIDRKVELNKNSLDGAERDYNSLLLGSGTTSLLLSAFGELDIQVKEAKKEDRLPPPFDPARIQLLIEDGKCICGCDIEKGDERTKQLHALIEKFKVSSDIGRLLDGASRESEKIISGLQSDWRAIESANKEISRISSESKELKAEREKLTIKLQGSDVASIRALADEKYDLDKLIEATIRKVTQLEIQADHAASKVARLDKELGESAKGNKEAENMRLEATSARVIADAALQIHQSAISQVRAELQSAISEKFKVVKQGEFLTEITDDFEVLTLYKDGTKVDLSEGESMAKAYIFSLALRDVINLGFPLIVDTPFGRLSEDFRVYLANVLSEFLVKESKRANRQIIFLMTDTEYTPYTRKNFSIAKPLEYYLAYEKGNESDKSYKGEGIDPGWLELTIWKAWSEGKLNV